MHEREMLALYRFSLTKGAGEHCPFKVVDMDPNGEPTLLGRFQAKDDAELFLQAKRAAFAKQPASA